MGTTFNVTTYGNTQNIFVWVNVKKKLKKINTIDVFHVNPKIGKKYRVEDYIFFKVLNITKVLFYVWFFFQVKMVISAKRVTADGNTKCGIMVLSNAMEDSGFYYLLLIQTESLSSCWMDPLCKQCCVYSVLLSCLNCMQTCPSQVISVTSDCHTHSQLFFDTGHRHRWSSWMLSRTWLNKGGKTGTDGCSRRVWWVWEEDMTGGCDGCKRRV